MDIVNKNRAGFVIFKLSNFQNRVEKKAVCPLVTAINLSSKETILGRVDCRQHLDTKLSTVNKINMLFTAESKTF